MIQEFITEMKSITDHKVDITENIMKSIGTAGIVMRNTDNKGIMIDMTDMTDMTGMRDMRDMTDTPVIEDMNTAIGTRGQEKRGVEVEIIIGKVDRGK